VVAGSDYALAVGAPAHAVDGAFVPLEGTCLPTGAHVPHLHLSGLSLVVPAGACKPVAVGAEAHAVYLAGVPLKDADLLARACVRPLHRPVVPSAGQAGAVGAEAHTVNPAGVSVEGEALLAGAYVPQLHRPVQRLVIYCTRQAGAVRAEGHAG